MIRWLERLLTHDPNTEFIAALCTAALRLDGPAEEESTIKRREKQEFADEYKEEDEAQEPPGRP